MSVLGLGSNASGFSTFDMMLAVSLNYLDCVKSIPSTHHLLIIFYHEKKLSFVKTLSASVQIIMHHLYINL